MQWFFLILLWLSVELKLIETVNNGSSYFFSFGTIAMEVSASYELSSRTLFVSFKFINKSKKLATVVDGDPKAPFTIATTPMYRGGHYSFSLDYSTLPLIHTL